MWKVLKTVQFISVSVVQNLACIVRNVSSFLSHENQEYILYILCDMKLETNYVWPLTRATKLKVKMMLFGLNQKSPVENFTYISRGKNVLLSHKIKNYTYI